MRVPTSPPPHQYLLLSAFSTRAITGRTRCYLIVVLICISIMTNNADHLFISSLAICTSSLKKNLFTSFTHFKSRLFILLLCWRSSLNVFWTQVSYQFYDLQIFSLSYIKPYILLVFLCVSSTKKGRISSTYPPIGTGSLHMVLYPHFSPNNSISYTSFRDNSGSVCSFSLR